MNPSTVLPRSADRLAWQAYADACCEHDGNHGRRAVAELVATHAVQPSRTAQGDARQ